MKIQILNGQFEASDALHILTEFVKVKIRYHEGKIEAESLEEDVKLRETRIRQLQNELEGIRNLVTKTNTGVVLKCDIEIQLTA